MEISPEFTAKTPSLIKLGACLLYELLTLVAILFVSAAVFVWLFGDASEGFKRLALQLFLWTVVGAYYVWCWFKSGQSLAMQAWKIQLTDRQAKLLDLKTAVMRYVLATFSLSAFGLGFFWALFDRQHLFLHDRLLNLRLLKSQ